MFLSLVYLKLYKRENIHYCKVERDDKDAKKHGLLNTHGRNTRKPRKNNA